MMMTTIVQCQSYLCVRETRRKKEVVAAIYLFFFSIFLIFYHRHHLTHSHHSICKTKRNIRRKKNRKWIEKKLSIITLIMDNFSMSYSSEASTEWLENDKRVKTAVPRREEKKVICVFYFQFASNELHLCFRFSW